MTQLPPDDRTDAYLWDPKATPDPEVQAVERLLEPLRLDATATPREWRPRTSPPRARLRWAYGLAAAAVVLIGLGWSLSAYRLSWPAGRAWTVDNASGGVPNELAVGSTLDLASSANARVNIARIGTMQVDPGARVTLRYTQGTRHRLGLDRGTVRVRTWAPPGSVAFITPAGEVIDMGCEFDLTVEASRTIVRVRSGWVQVANNVEESLIPAGAASEMRADRAPGIAVFEDARPGFAAAVRALEVGTGDRDAHVATIASLARARDMYTLLMLVERQTYGSDRLAAAAADLVPPPTGVTVNGIIRGDRDALWRWRDTLPLPPVKGWLRNWRDGLPEWLIGRD